MFLIEFIQMPEPMWSATLLESVARVLSLYDSCGMVLAHAFMPSFPFSVTPMILVVTILFLCILYSYLHLFTC